MNIIYNFCEYKNYSKEEALAEGIPSDVINAALIDEAWRLIRNERDALLRASDYAVMPDYPMTDEQLAEVKTYRQALRDIPETAGSPDAVEWPTKPEFLA